MAALRATTSGKMAAIEDISIIMFAGAFWIVRFWAAIRCKCWRRFLLSNKTMAKEGCCANQRLRTAARNTLTLREQSGMISLCLQKVWKFALRLDEEWIRSLLLYDWFGYLYLYSYTYIIRPAWNITWARSDSCKKHKNVSRQTYSYVRVKLRRL